MNKLVIGKVESEFQIQAYLYWKLKHKMHDCKGEVRATCAGRRLRFDILCWNSERQMFGVEVKPKRGLNWREYWMCGKQFMTYNLLPIPVYMVLGMSEAEDFSALDHSSLFDRRGVVWREQWKA